MNFALILAGGQGRRFAQESGSDTPKQFVKLSGKPILWHTLNNFEQCADVDNVIIVSCSDHIQDCRNLVDNFCIRKVSGVIAGGINFWDSLACGLDYLTGELEAQSDDIVTVHGAACPLATAQIIADNIAGAIKWGACAASPHHSVSTWPVDSDGFVDAIAKRKAMRQVQFPFSYSVSVLQDSMSKFDTKAVHPEVDHPVLAAGYKMFLSKGSYENIKITTIEDLEFVKRFIE